MNRRPRPSRIWLVAAMLLGPPAAALAGDLEPPGPPAPTMKSLDEVPPVWSQRLDSSDGDPNGCDSTRFRCVMDGLAILDLETGLVWERSPAGATTVSWGQAISECLSLSLGGRRGWRLPRVEEFLSLFVPGQSNPALPAGHPFTQVGSDVFWTASTSHHDTLAAIEVSAASGQWVTEDKDSSLNRRWCVRGGPPNAFTSQPNG